MPLIAAPVVLGAFVLFALLLYIQSWQRPSTGPLITAEPAKQAGGVIARSWHWLANAASNSAGARLLHGFVHGTLQRLVASIEHWTQAALSHAIAGLVKPTVQWLSGLEQVSRTGWLELGHFAQEVHDALYHLRHTTIPALIRAALAPVRALAAEAHALGVDAQGRIDNARDALLGALAATGIGAWSTLAAGLNGLVHALSALHDQVWDHVTPRLDYLTGTAIPAIYANLEIFTNDLYNTGADSLAGLRRRLKDLEGQALALPGEIAAGALALLGSLAFVDAVVAAIALRLPWLGCNNTRNTLTKLCGLDEKLLGELLAGTLALLVALDARAIAEAAQGVTGELDSLIREVAHV